MIFQDVDALLIWGGDPITIGSPVLFSGSLIAGGIYFPKYRLFMITVAVIVTIGLWLFENKTRAGAVIRAVVDNVEMARGMGINTSLVSLGVYALGCRFSRLSRGCEQEDF